MTTAIIDNETRYAIPDYDLDFFIAIANKMGWKKVKSSFAKKESWVDQFAGKWQDTRSTDEIIADIHDDIRAVGGFLAPLFVQAERFLVKRK